MAQCVTCGADLHPERAAKYDYCLDPECQARNARRLTIASVGVNKGFGSVRDPRRTYQRGDGER